MAITKKEQFVLDLSDKIKTQVETWSNFKTNVRAKQEAEFQRRITNEGLTYDQQLSIREIQLKDEQNKSVPDSNFISELKTEVVNLKKLSKYQKIREDYLNNYNDYKSGKSSINSFIELLENRLDIETDSTLREQYLIQLSDLKFQKFQNESTILNNRIILAQKDKSIGVIDNVIGEVNKKRDEALLKDNRELVSTYDVQIQNLKSSRQQLISTDKLHNFELKVDKDGLAASQKLDILNDTISSSNKATRFTVNGVDYNSEFEYFTDKKNQYLSGSGTGEFKDFISEFYTETKQKIANLSVMNQFGSIPLSSIDSINKDYQTLAQKPEFANLKSQLETYRLGNMTDAVDKVATAIQTEAESFGDYSRGEQALRNIQTRFGIDTSSYIGKLYETKITTVPTKMERVTKTAEVLAEQKGTTPEKEFEELTKSPFKEEPKVIEEALKPVEEPKKEEVKIEVPKIEPVKAPKIITVQKGETLSGISQRELGVSGRWKELKTEAGQTFDETSAKKLQVGTKLIIPT